MAYESITCGEWQGYDEHYQVGRLKVFRKILEKNNFELRICEEMIMKWFKVCWN